MSIISYVDPKFDLTKKDRSEIISELKKKLSGRVSSGYIFGSYSTSEHGPESDIDLVLIKETSVPFTQRALEFSDLLDVFPEMDILVYTPEEFKKQREHEEGFLKTSSLLKIV